MLDDMKVIGHDASPRQAQLDGSPEGLAHIPAHRFHPIAVGEALKQTHDIVLFTPSTPLEHLAGIQVAQDCVVALSLASGKLINHEIAWSRQRLALFDAQAALGQLNAGPALQTALHEPWTHPVLAGDMGDRTA